MQAATTREEKQLENSLESLIQRVQEYKNSIQAFIMKLEIEHEVINWPAMLDSFALLSGQLNNLNRLLKNENIVNLRNQIILPIVLMPDNDLGLEKLTEGRVKAFNHEVVPDYLRTKPEPEVEEQCNILNARVNLMPPEMVQKQVNTLNKLVTNVLETIKTHTVQRESEMNQKFIPPETSSQADTIQLLAAINVGKGLKREDTVSNTTTVVGPGRPGGIGGVRISGPTPNMQQQINMGYQRANPSYYAGKPQAQQQQMKAQTSIKTNVRAAHPYMRP